MRSCGRMRRFPGGGHLSVEFTDDAPDDEHPRLACRRSSRRAAGRAGRGPCPGQVLGPPELFHGPCRINGNTHREDLRPPFRPAAVLDAIRQVLARPRLSGSLITGIVGPPDFITGCTVTGDLAALAAGQYAELGLHARVTVTDAAHVRDRVTKAAVPGHRPPGFTRDPARPVIVIDKFPPYVNTDEVILSIADRAQGHPWHARHPELGALTRLPITNVEDLTTARGGYWFACLPSDGTPPQVLRDQLLKVHGVSIYITTRLPRPLPAMIRTWTRANHDEDLPGSLTALENALASRRQRRLAQYY